MKLWFRWHNASGIGVLGCTRWWPWFWIHRNWGRFDFDGLISMQLGPHSIRGENQIEREKFEHFKRSAFFDCTNAFTTSEGVTSVCAFVEFLRGRWRWLYVWLLIMMTWEIVEWLYCWGGLWVERYAILICTCKIFESMNRGLLMLRMWSIAVWGKKC